jgi:IS30 family transposase
MGQKERRELSPVERAELWTRFTAGESFTAIGRALGRHVGSVYAVVRMHVGIARPVRRRARGALTLEDREAISRGLAAGESIRGMAQALQRAPSTISREITRNAGPNHYRAVESDARAWRAAKRPKPTRLALHRPLRVVVAAKLLAKWSPAQIAGWLVNEYPDNPRMHVSHETIYRSLFVQARGVLKRELTAHLRTRRPMRRSKRASKAGQTRGQIVDAVSITERPATVEDRAIPGHWEGDLLSGAKNSHIATLVERPSRYVHLVKVTGNDTTAVVNGLLREVQRLPAGLMTSLTWDRGLEMAQHARFTVAADVAVYFCDPQSPWQRGTNENTNGLLRQYLPDGTDLSVYTQHDLNHIGRQLNTRPRKTLGFRTPAAIFAQAVALTG